MYSLSEDMSSLIAERRSHALKVELPFDAEIYESWPWSRFDDEDEIFFLVGDDTWDSASIRFTLCHTNRAGSRNVYFHSEFVFFALGRSSSDVRDIQCTLVNYSAPLASTIDELQGRISAWDHDRFQILDLLQYRNIPKISGALFEPHGTKKVALISYKLLPASDFRGCQRKFWRVEFSIDIYPAEKVPGIESGV